MEPFIGQIMAFGGNFAPRGWALCDGQLLPISSNSALFSILGTTYGGDGRTTFGLPDLRGRVAMHAGNGPGLSDRRLGAKGGSETNTMNVTQLPSHNHTLTVDVKQRALADAGTTDDPSNAFLASNSNGDLTFAPTQDADMGAPVVTAAAGNTGGQQPINNMQPFETVNYIIALQGIYPSRS